MAQLVKLVELLFWKLATVLMAMKPRLVVVQPTPYCNLDCSYCYLTRRDLKASMGLDVIGAIVERVAPLIKASAPATWVWHGGEPTATPLEWYERAYEILASADAQRKFLYSIQTNGVALTQRWIDLFVRNSTTIGVSVDGPKEFHDSRRRTRSGHGTWDRVERALDLLRANSIEPTIITVLSPEALRHPKAFFDFYRERGLTNVSFSIDEQEGPHQRSSFVSATHRAEIGVFIASLLRLARDAGFPLHIREVERVLRLLTEKISVDNEQVEPWAILTIDYLGNVTTFSPELTEFHSKRLNDYRFGNVLIDGPTDWAQSEAFRQFSAEVAAGVHLCRESCGYFPVCGGGAPSNKISELGTAAAAETEFCRLSIQAACDGAAQFLKGAPRAQPKESLSPVSG